MVAIMASDPQVEDSQIDSQPSIIRRSWQAILSPFSPSALEALPNVRRPARYLRADDIPATETDTAGERPTVRDYHSITSLPPQVRVPKKIKTSVKVEGKVWFANERSESTHLTLSMGLIIRLAWISWLNVSILLATLSLGLFNASKDDIARKFAYVYAFISVAILVSRYMR